LKTNAQLTELLMRIEALQADESSDFGSGLFPSYRQNSYWLGYRRADYNIFFSAIIAFSLQELTLYLSPENQEIVQRIVGRIRGNYPAFQNKDGLLTYNFYRTKPARHFTPGYLLHRFRHFKLPDDADDTAMVFLTTEPPPEAVLGLQRKLAEHANGSRQHIRNTYPEYRKLKAYSTWFGQKMYIEFDACVLANVLYCLRRYDVPLNDHDEDCLRYIKGVVLSGQYSQAPFRVAHQYPRTPLIIYHIARLLAAFDWPQMAECRTRLLTDAKQLIQQTTCRIDFYLLATSLMRLGEPITQEPPVQRGDFYFFIGGFLTAYEQPLLYRMASSPFFHVRWQCSAHELALELEYEVLRQHQ
jgi:hypothetical protein